jgi:hypothetical protein
LIVFYTSSSHHHVFQFTFISSGYSKYIYNYLLNVNRHLLSYIICIFIYDLCPFYNKIILKHLRSVPFKFPPLHFHDFHGSISSDTYMKIKLSHHKFVLWDDTLARYNLTIYTVLSPISSSKDKIDLARVLTIVESN